MKRAGKKIAIFTAIALMVPMLLLPEAALAKPSGALNWDSDDRTGNGGIGWPIKIPIMEEEATIAGIS